MLKCKICKNKMSILGENSLIEPIVSCSKCGFTNKKTKNKKEVIIEYVNR